MKRSMVLFGTGLALSTSLVFIWSAVSEAEGTRRLDAKERVLPAGAWLVVAREPIKYLASDQAIELVPLGSLASAVTHADTPKDGRPGKCGGRIRVEIMNDGTTRHLCEKCGRSWRAREKLTDGGN